MSTQQLRNLVANIVGNRSTQDLLTSYGVKAHAVTWEDAGRNKGSCWGPNISDMTLIVKDGSGLMPVIRKPNFSDVTEDIKIDTFTLKVGNEAEGASTKNVSLREYLKNIKAYTDNTHTTNLFLDRDEVILTSSQCCVLPVSQGTTEFAVQLFNYQSYESSPAVLVILVSKDGVSTQVIERSNQKLFFNDHGTARWFKVERLQDYRERVTGEKQEKVKSHTEMKDTERQENVLMMFQVPLKVKERTRGGPAVFCNAMSLGATRGVRGGRLECAMAGSASARGMDMGMLGLGSKEGKFTGTKDLVLERDERFPIRCTFQYYRVTDQDFITEPDVKDIVNQLSQSSKMAVASGSLVQSTTERKTEPDLTQTKPTDDWSGKLGERDYLKDMEDKPMATFLVRDDPMDGSSEKKSN